MNIKKCRKEEFTVIGKMGKTADGADFVNTLWRKANEGMGEIEALVKRDGRGAPVGFWGLRSAMDAPLGEWVDGEGKYLAGLEVKDGSFAPMGWTKWVVPASVYVNVEVDGTMEDAIREVNAYAEKNKLVITGAYHEYMNVFLPGKLLLFFPVKEKSVFVLSDEGKKG